MWSICALERYSAMKRSEVPTPVTTQTRLKNVVSETRHKGHVSYGSICMKHPELANPEAVNQWVPGAGRRWAGVPLR